jgi:hypothetical protein
MNHIGDIYFSSLFIQLICSLNKETPFLYYFINGDIFFENICNIQRLGKRSNIYFNNLISGQPPENLVNNEILRQLIQNNMQSKGSEIINIDNEQILFINTWCASKYLNSLDFDIYSSITSYAKLIQTINKEYNLNLIFNIDDPKYLLNDISYYNNLFCNKYSNIYLTDTIFIFNYNPRSCSFNMTYLNNYILELSKTTKIILACYNNIFENNQNITFVDKDYNIIQTPKCDNLIEMWEIAVKCNKIIILPTGCSWTFLHLLTHLKQNQIFMFNGNQYTNRLNNNIKLLLGEESSCFIQNMV